MVKTARFLVLVVTSVVLVVAFILTDIVCGILDLRSLLLFLSAAFSKLS